MLNCYLFLPLHLVVPVDSTISNDTTTQILGPNVFCLVVAAASVAFAVAAQKTRVQVWLFEGSDLKLEGQIVVSVCRCLRRGVCRLVENDECVWNACCVRVCLSSASTNAISNDIFFTAGFVVIV